MQEVIRNQEYLYWILTPLEIQWIKYLTISSQCIINGDPVVSWWNQLPLVDYTSPLLRRKVNYEDVMLAALQLPLVLNDPKIAELGMPYNKWQQRVDFILGII
jgi:hypothetical protein